MCIGSPAYDTASWVLPADQCVSNSKWPEPFDWQPAFGYARGQPLAQDQALIILAI